MSDVVFQRHSDVAQFWRSWDGKMYEYIGMDRNKDPLMRPLDGDNNELRCISSRALNRTWYPKWRSLCCDRWLNYEPEPSQTECFHTKN